jgi:hypothetical protein
MQKQELLELSANSASLVIRAINPKTKAELGAEP